MPLSTISHIPEGEQEKNKLCEHRLPAGISLLIFFLLANKLCSGKVNYTSFTPLVVTPDKNKR
jgi:hypothetical protein